MDTLDLNLHQLVLRDLAASIADKSDISTSNELVVDAISSRVRARDLSSDDTDPSRACVTTRLPYLYFCSEQAVKSVSSVECGITFGELAANSTRERRRGTHPSFDRNSFS